MHYAISYKNSAGHTQRSEFTRFDNDNAAIDQGRRGVRDNAIVKVWKGDHLLVRVTQKEPSEASEPAAV